MRNDLKDKIEELGKNIEDPFEGLEFYEDEEME